MLAPPSSSMQRVPGQRSAAGVGAGLGCRQPGPGLRRASRPQAASTDSASTALVSPSPRAKVMSLLQQGEGNYSENAAQLDAAVDALVAAGSPTPVPARATVTLGVGTWEVFSAPHIRRLSQPLGAKFQPIRYTLKGDGGFVSNVKYRAPLLGAGWLSASGSLAPKDDASLLLSFQSFWVDLGAASLRPELGFDQGPDAAAAELSRRGLLMDRAIASIGRTFFLKQLAAFPVLYLDPELAVFEFSALQSKIAVRKLA